MTALQHISLPISGPENRNRGKETVIFQGRVSDGMKTGSEDPGFNMSPAVDHEGPLRMKPNPTDTVDSGRPEISKAEPAIQRMSWSDDGCNLTANYSIGCHFIGRGDYGWDEPRERTFQTELKSVIEETFNNNSYRMTPSAARQDTNWLEENVLDYIPWVNYDCPCASGYTPQVNVEVSGHGSSMSDWGVYVSANPEGGYVQSRVTEGTGYLDEGDVNPGSGGQIGAVHEFGHYIGLHHPGRNVELAEDEDEYSHTGRDEHGNEVEGAVDLMGEGMGLRPFYFNAWLERLNNDYPGCNFTIGS